RPTSRGSTASRSPTDMGLTSNEAIGTPARAGVARAGACRSGAIPRSSQVKEPGGYAWSRQDSGGKDGDPPTAGEGGWTAGRAGIERGGEGGGAGGARTPAGGAAGMGRRKYGGKAMAHASALGRKKGHATAEAYMKGLSKG